MDIGGKALCLPITLRRDGADAVGYVYRTIGLVDESLATRLHDRATSSPWSVRSDGDLTRITAFTGEVASALISGAIHRGDLVTVATPITAQALIDRGDEGRWATMTTLSPIRTVAAKPSNRTITTRPDALFPDPVRILDDLAVKWESLAWPPLPEVNVTKVGGELVRYAPSSLRAGRLEHRGWHGVVTLDMRGLTDADRAVIWTLLRFGELRNVGRNVSYGMGAIRVESCYGDR